MNWKKAGFGALYRASWVDGAIQSESDAGIIRWKLDGSVQSVLGDAPEYDDDPELLKDKRLARNTSAACLLEDGTLISWTHTKGIERWIAEATTPSVVSKPKKGRLTSNRCFGTFDVDGKVLVLFDSYEGWVEAFDVETGSKLCEAGAFGEVTQGKRYGSYIVHQAETLDGQNSHGTLQVFDKKGERIANLASGGFIYDVIHYEGRLFFTKDEVVAVWGLDEEKIVAELKMPINPEFLQEAMEEAGGGKLDKRTLDALHEESAPIRMQLRGDTIIVELLYGGLALVRVETLTVESPGKSDD